MLVIRCMEQHCMKTFRTWEECMLLHERLLYIISLASRMLFQGPLLSCWLVWCLAAPVRLRVV
jgi:hypothetical protein